MPVLPEVSPQFPWDRQQGESPQAFEAFALYRDQAPTERSYRRVAQALGKSESLIGEWCSLHNWTTRAAAWDQHQHRAQDEAVEAAERRMAATYVRRRAQAGRALVERALRRVAQMTDAEIARLTPDEVARWVKLGSDLEALAYGGSTANVAISADVTVGDGRGVDDRLNDLFALRRKQAVEGIVVALPEAEEA